VFGFGFLSMCKQALALFIAPYLKKEILGDDFCKVFLEINYLCKTVLKKEMSN
jgi:hypothetical protein